MTDSKMVHTALCDPPPQMKVVLTPTLRTTGLEEKNQLIF